MTQASARSASPPPFSIWERWAFLFGRITILLGMMIAVLVFYTITWRHYSVPKSLLFQYLVMLIAASWGAIAIRRHFVRSALATPAAFLLAVMAFSMLFAVNLGESYEVIKFKIACLVFLILIPKFFTRFQDFTVLAYVFGFLCLCVNVYGLAQYYNWTWFFDLFGEGFSVSVMTGEPVSTMGNINYTAEFLNIAVPIMLCMMIVYRRRPPEFLFFSFISLLNAAILYYIDCNATYAGFIVAIPIVLLILVYDRMIPLGVGLGVIRTNLPAALRYFRHGVVVGILLVSLFAVLLTAVPNPALNKMTTMVSWVDTNGDNVSDGNSTIIFRLQCMDSAIRTISNSFMFGIGPGNFKIIHPLYESQLERKVLGREVLARKVHNDHLQHAMKYGIFGLFGFYWVNAVILYAIIYSMFQLRHRPASTAKSNATEDESDAVVLPAQGLEKLSDFQKNFLFYLLLGILGGVITALVSCFFGHTFVIESSAVTYWMMGGIAVAIFQYLRRKENDIPQPAYGATPEAPNTVQRIARGYLPNPLPWAICLALVLPVGARNVDQLIGESWLKMGMARNEAQQFNELFYCFERSKAFYPYQMEIYYIFGRYYIDAIGHFAHANNLPTPEERHNYLYGKQIYPDREMQYVNEGIVCLQTDIYLNPNYKWAHNNLGVLYDKLENYDLSRATYHRVLEIDPEQIYAQFNLGLGSIRLAQSGDFDKIRHTVHPSIASSMTNDELIRFLYGTAVDYMEVAANIEPDYVDAYRYMATSFIMTHDYLRAKQSTDRYVSILLQRRLESAMASPGFRRFQPIVEMLKEGELQNALAEAYRLLQFHDQTAQLLYLQCAIESIDSNREVSLESLNKALSMAPFTDTNRIDIAARLYQSLGQLDQAALQYQQYLRYKPDDWAIRRSLANLYAMQNQYDSAIQVFQKLIEGGAADAGDYVSLARLMIGAGKYRYQDVLRPIQLAVQLGGDQAREMIIAPDPTNFIFHSDIIDRSSEIPEMLGESFMERYRQNKAELNSE